MSAIKINGVRVLNSSAPFHEKLQFEVTLEVAEPLTEDAVFHCFYVVDPAQAKTDVELESIDVGPLPVGVMNFVFEPPGPTTAMVEASGGALEVGGLYVSAVYRGKEFCRVGYFVRHEYESPELQESPPEPAEWGKLRRVLSEPCVTRFTIQWDAPAPAAGAPAPAPGPEPGCD
eukprot:CAMPEP_0179268100 /NCGR_PEP_ID=MMETSP0797-20121207/30268_1 /TAXON_ID=47934 /ORGANISM="Dinophysis acuminata, Strain DAEP01" /LENGTH=173 /DNA_ID=CAMNT_0020976375 /DNA_START=70 /DNA_END=588 /DNA_ORIENTATION=+